jgi:hypothetical protein
MSAEKSSYLIGNRIRDLQAYMSRITYDVYYTGHTVVREPYAAFLNC